MVEIGIAIAAATKAVGTLKKGLALGNDLVSLKNDFNKVFDAKNALEQAKAAAELELPELMQEIREEAARKKAKKLAATSGKIEPAQRFLDNMNQNVGY